MCVYILTGNNIAGFVAGWLSRQALRRAPHTWLSFSVGAGGSRPWTGSPSGAPGLAARRAQKLALGDNVRPAAQLLLAALADEVLPVPGQVLHALVVLREYDLGGEQKKRAC